MAKHTSSTPCAEVVGVSDFSSVIIDEGASRRAPRRSVDGHCANAGGSATSQMKDSWEGPFDRARSHRVALPDLPAADADRSARPPGASADARCIHRCNSATEL